MNVVPLTIQKPASFLERFKSKRGSTIAGVETLLTALPILKISEANDWVRLHPSEDYWSYELCFVNVPIIGDKRDQLHLIDEEIAVQYLSSKRVLRFRLALRLERRANSVRKNTTLSPKVEGVLDQGLITSFLL